MSVLPADVSAFIASGRLGRLATADGTGQPLVVPICYAWDGEALVSAIDAKPKRAGDLKRVRNIRENPKVSVVIDKDEKVYLNGQPISESQLASQIEANLGKAQAGDRKVLLKAHKDCTAIRFEPVIEAISQAGGELVHVLEDKKKK